MCTVGLKMLLKLTRIRFLLCLALGFAREIRRTLEAPVHRLVHLGQRSLRENAAQIPFELLAQSRFDAIDAILFVALDGVEL